MQGVLSDPCDPQHARHALMAELMAFAATASAMSRSAFSCARNNTFP
jgi:hypothetical protein